MKLLLEILFSFAKVGVFGYGGGPSMIPLLKAEVVDQNKWLTEADFIDALAIGNSLPGPIATKMSAYVGFKIAGIPGAVAALMGMVLPSVILMLIVALLFWAYKDTPQVRASLKAVRPAVVALLAIVVYDMFPHSVTSWHTGLIALATFVIIVYFKLHPALAIAAAALLGVLVY
jgi:chromate transporter